MNNGDDTAYYLYRGFNVVGNGLFPGALPVLLGKNPLGSGKISKMSDVFLIRFRQWPNKTSTLLFGTRKIIPSGLICTLLAYKTKVMGNRFKNTLPFLKNPSKQQLVITANSFPTFFPSNFPFQGITPFCS